MNQEASVQQVWKADIDKSGMVCVLEGEVVKVQYEM